MNAQSARKALVAAHNAPAEITREARKSLNPALHALRLPTLGAHKTLVAYFAALTPAQQAQVREIVAPAPKREKAARKAWTCSCTSVREHIRAHKAA